MVPGAKFTPGLIPSTPTGLTRWVSDVTGEEAEELFLRAFELYDSFKGQRD